MTIEASSVMTRDVVTVAPEDRVTAIARRMAERGISAVPVVDREGRILGMISEGDLMRHYSGEYQRRRSWWLNLIAEGQDLAAEFLDYLRLDQRQAKDLMKSPVVTASEGMSLAEIADLFMKHGIKRVPIVKDGRLVGLVSRADLIRAIATAPEQLVEPI